MKRLSIIFIALLMVNILLPIKYSFAAVLINEFLADPPKGLEGDANNDGVSSTSNDEFIEIVNFGTSKTDISQWSIKDKVAVRHVFESGTILEPYECIVVFGGGTPTGFEVKVNVASTGSLGLNNSGDNIALYDFNGGIKDSVIYNSEGNRNQSLTRYPDGEEEFVLHAEISETEDLIYSPGKKADGRWFQVVAVPEISSIFLVGFCMFGYFSRKKNRRIGNEKHECYFKT